jgi:hypothetical protein
LGLVSYYLFNKNGCFRSMGMFRQLFILELHHV